ncbi:RxLR effector protein [Phytophthora megakarya]|uniref:RxLR effector protein n=1 Tax=Phytophthora megakarya TaxID=4795 RepID=A0A225X2M2_9STRA|nr:RxLR effector protein [Phytophthora megakarya]
MRLSCILMSAVSAISALQAPVTTAVGSDAVLTGIVSLGVLHLVGADQGVSDQSRFLRGNDVTEGDKEERGFSTADAKNLVTKLFRTNSFSDLKNVDDLTTLDKISGAADDHLGSVFKFAHQNGMDADDLTKELKTFQELDDDFITKAREMYSNYLKGLRK